MRSKNTGNDQELVATLFCMFQCLSFQFLQEILVYQVLQLAQEDQSAPLDGVLVL